MLIKIGDAWVDPEEIVMVCDSYDSHLEIHPQICIHLRNGSGTWIHSTLDEAEAALMPMAPLAHYRDRFPVSRDADSFEIKI